MTTDYRRGLRASRRRVASRQAIRKSLKSGRKKFSELLNETGLSRSTLAFHLKEMSVNGEVERESNPKDYRITFYQLNEMWNAEIQKEEDIEALNSMEIAYSIPPEAITDFVKEAAKFLEPSFREHFLRTNKLVESLEEYISYSVYAGRRIRGKLERSGLGKVATQGALSMLSELLSTPERLEETLDFNIIFRFNKEKISGLAQKLQKEVQAPDDSVKLPDIKSYGGSSSRNQTRSARTSSS